MKLYNTRSGIVIEKDSNFYVIKGETWDGFINDDDVYVKAEQLTSRLKPDGSGKNLIENELLPPIGTQEIWAAGVTYIRSKVGRQEESKNSGGGEFYARVYEAERPEIFFKSTAYRASGHKGKVRIRKDSTWDVPEPELTLMITTSGKIIGYTIGNDMSSRSIEGENPLYLPQAKSYDRSAAIGPCIYITNHPLPPNTTITLEIFRGPKVFEASIAIDQIKRSFQELVGFLYRETSFATGALLMTGTGIVPGNDFTLKVNDEVRITIPPIGTMINYVE
jgi:2-dehydro-3-deoxy-D-arabinonate dehydratase